MSKSRTKIKHQLKQGEPGGLNRHWRGLFLDYLAESSNVKQSAAKAGINPSRAYKVRREEPEFARQWLASLYEGYIHLEMEVLRRLRATGCTVPIVLCSGHASFSVPDEPRDKSELFAPEAGLA